MSEFKLNKKILTALLNCKDVKEVMALAKSQGIDLNEEQAGEDCSDRADAKFNTFENQKLFLK